MGQLLIFARALDVPVTDLTGQPYAVNGPEEDAGQGAVAGIRRELLLAEREPRIDAAQAAAVSVPALRSRVENMSGRHRSAALASMGHDLPALLHDLRVTRHAAPASQCASVYGLLAQAYEAAMDMLKQTGYVADATAAIEWARWAAFGPSNVAIWSVALPVEMLDAAEAVTRALQVNPEAERIAPHKTRINPAAREVVSHLLRSRRQNDLVELALRLGVA
jgi:hypothetical protein